MACAAASDVSPGLQLKPSATFEATQSAVTSNLWQCLQSQSPACTPQCSLVHLILSLPLLPPEWHSLVRKQATLLLVVAALFRLKTYTWAPDLCFLAKQRVSRSSKKGKQCYRHKAPGICILSAMSRHPDRHLVQLNQATKENCIQIPDMTPRPKS